jgi:hypothetical protein
MSDFLKVARDRGVYDPEGKHETLAKFASTYFGSALKANIESLASSLAAKPEMFPPFEPRQGTYADLVEVIQRTLNDIYETPADASTKDLFSKFAQALVRLRNRVVVITFNYDLLIDQLLRDTNEWFPVDGYGFELPLAGFPSATSQRLVAEAKLRKGKRAEEPLSAMPLLKMHGSLNWGTRNLPYPDSTSPIELCLLGALPSDDAMKKLGPINMSVLQRLRPSSYYWKTYIVPPLLAKMHAEASNPLSDNIWYQARGAMVFADSVHILGYSMPPSDFEMEMLVREGLHCPFPHKPNKRVFVVNRDIRTAERIKNVLEFGDVTVDISCSDIIEHLTAVLPELTA